MKSPKLMTFIVAVVFAAIVFAIASASSITPVLAAILVFIASFVSPLIGSSAKPTASTSNDNQAEVNVGNATTLYIGNLPYRANETAVRELFAQHGQVQSVRLMKDKHTGKRRGFGFVEIAEKDAAHVIESLNDTEFQQRTLKVREAKERPETNA